MMDHKTQSDKKQQPQQQKATVAANATAAAGTALVSASAVAGKSDAKHVVLPICPSPTSDAFPDMV